MELAALIDKVLFWGWTAFSALVGVAFLAIGVADVRNRFRGVQLHFPRRLTLADERPNR